MPDGRKELSGQLRTGNPDATTAPRMVFRFELAGERWNWPVDGDDSIRAFRELLMLARIPFRVSL